jgi:membrane protein
MRIPGLGGIPLATLGKRSAREFTDDDMPTYAAALAYHAMFALFPFLIFLVALLGFLQIPQFFDWVLEQAQAALPGEAYTNIASVVKQVEGQQRGGLLSFGIIAAIWGASSGVRALMKALNTAYDVEETRAIWKIYLFSLLYTLGFAALLIVAGGLMLLGPQGFEWLAGQAGLDNVFVTLWTWLRWPVAVLLLMLTAAIVYYVVPNVDQPFRFITPGAVVAVLVWIIASIGFSVYASNFANYDATYGSLAGVVVLLFYFFISGAVLLLGAEINAEVYHLKKGKPEPASEDEKADPRPQ